jgi:Ser/Thr protein kinase RdoA (MazF antagonist)
MGDAFLVMKTSPPEISETAASRLLRDQFGIEGDLETLVSEHDQNFCVRQASGESFILKITNSAEAVELTDFQTGALLHIAEVDPDFPAPRVVRSIDGKTRVAVTADDGREHTVRVLSRLGGIPLRYADPVPDNAEQLGQHLARLGVALQSFSWPAIDYNSPWDLKHAANLQEFIEKLDDQALHSVCSECMLGFLKHTAPVLESLPSQVIHNDLNPGNVIVDSNDAERITGVIDFGDVVHSPLIVDVAIAAAYMLDDIEEPLARIVMFLRGYSNVRRLAEKETDLLYDLILKRNVTTIVIAHWLAKHYPENRDYILIDVERARESIRRLTSLGRSKVSLSFREACAQ